jgi:hypothetical protein
MKYTHSDQKMLQNCNANPKSRKKHENFESKKHTMGRIQWRRVTYYENLTKLTYFTYGKTQNSNIL